MSSARRVSVNSSKNDPIILDLLLFVAGVGTDNVFFGRYHVLDTVAPWIRSIVTLAPDPNLMRNVPLTYKIHILAVLFLFALSPFSRLIHIWSLPLPYIMRNYIIFRKRDAEPP
ncbi:MAG: respiratory nitrate reductase subunit gamma [Syntrophobacter sp.]